MRKIKNDKKVYESVVITEKGEVKETRTVYRQKDEPDFIKLYVDCICLVKGLRKGLSPIFIALLSHMSYANADDDEGGQIIIINNYVKQQIAKKLKFNGISSIDKALSEFVRKGLLRRISIGTYQVNPNIVGKGDWTDIKNIRANVDFSARTITADIVKAK